MAFWQQLFIEAGSTFSEVQFQYLQDDGITPVDLTGYTAKMQLRLKPSSPVALEIFPTIDSETGTVSVNMTAEETAELTRPKYIYAIELTANSNEPVIRLIEGDVLVSLEVVR